MTHMISVASYGNGPTELTPPTSDRKWRVISATPLPQEGAQQVLVLWVEDDSDERRLAEALNRR